MFSTRPDGRLAKDVPPFRRIMPFIMRTRNESIVYFEQELELDRTLPFLDAFTARTGLKVSIFHLFMWAAVRALGERPRLNRFVAGGRIWERDGIWMSFSAKKAIRDDAPIVVIKREFDPKWSFEQVVRALSSDVTEGRSEQKNHVDRELGLFLRLPGPLLKRGVSLLRRLDDFGMLPEAFIRPDPMYASMFVANLGSVRLDSAFHHLYEYGTIPLFAAIGRKKVIAGVDAEGKIAPRTVCSIKYAFDERVEDGLYCASGLERIRAWVEDPEGTARGEGV